MTRFISVDDLFPMSDEIIDQLSRLDLDLDDCLDVDRDEPIRPSRSRRAPPTDELGDEIDDDIPW